MELVQPWQSSRDKNHFRDRKHKQKENLFGVSDDNNNRSSVLQEPKDDLNSTSKNYFSVRRVERDLP